ncbi:MAG: PAS domain-containing protein [Bacteroidota bacterium]|jgi:PAS domain S-box-containing protein
MKPVKKQSQKKPGKNGKKRYRTKILKKAGSGSGDLKKLIELLQINQIELEHQNEELRITEEELEASRNKYVNLFDFSPLPYFALDPEGNITKVNVNGARMFGVERSKLMGKSFLSYIVHEEKNIFTSFMKSVFSASEKQSCKLKVVNKDKKVFHVLMEGVALEGTPGGEQRCQIALIDLTEFKKLEEAYEQVSLELKILKAEKKKS